MSLRILIVEDEELVAQHTLRLIQETEPGSVVVAVTDSIETTVAWLQKNEPFDVAIMDIQLADGSSFEIFKQASFPFPVIFLTAYDEYALKAFKVNSIDYLLKPLKKEELRVALQKFKRLTPSFPAIDYHQLAQLLQTRTSPYLSRLMIKIGQQIKVFSIDEAAYFYIDQKIVFVKLKSGDRYPLDYTIDQLEQQLHPENFFRINRSIIISFGAIDRMFMYSKSRIKLILKPVCEVEAVSSTDRSPLFKDWLSGKSSAN